MTVSECERGWFYWTFLPLIPGVARHRHRVARREVEALRARFGPPPLALSLFEGRMLDETGWHPLPGDGPMLTVLGTDVENSARQGLGIESLECRCRNR
jgi:hypothetical protein